MAKGSKALESTIKTDGTTVYLANGAGTEPDDATLENGQILLWVNESGNKLKIKLKYADGTVKSHEMALS